MDKKGKDILPGEIKEDSILSFEKIFRMYYKRIYLFVNKLVVSQDVAKDITQDVFVKFWVNRDRVDPERSCLGLLYTMAKNASLDYLRSKFHSFIPLVNDIMDTPDTEGQSEKTILDMPDIQARIEKSISQLPAQQQKVFVMGKLDNMSNKEIAEALDISVRTVEKHMELAKKNIRGKLS